MRNETVKVQNPAGLHARPAAEVVRIARGCSLQTTLAGRGKTADAKSILAVLALGVRQGDDLEVTVEGGSPAEEERVLGEIRAVLERAEG